MCTPLVLRGLHHSHASLRSFTTMRVLRFPLGPLSFIRFQSMGYPLVQVFLFWGFSWINFIFLYDTLKSSSLIINEHLDAFSQTKHICRTGAHMQKQIPANTPVVHSCPLPVPGPQGTVFQGKGTTWQLMIESEAGWVFRLCFPIYIEASGCMEKLRCVNVFWLLVFSCSSQDSLTCFPENAF